jgi:thiol:disulfide interchange protein DsbC
MSSFFYRLIIGWVALAFAAAALGDESAAVKTALQRIIPGMQPDRVSAAPVAGWYEVAFGAEIFYVSADGGFLLQGDLVDLGTRTNLTERARSSVRAELIKTVDPADAIIFKPEKPLHVVYVFTDVDCAYCRKMHSEIDQYLAQGIEIRYLAFPRTGVNTPSFFKAVSVWCAADRGTALTEAKAGRTVPAKTCDNPVTREMDLAAKVGVDGTPTLVFSDGAVVPGYVNAAQLRRILDNNTGG